MFTRLTYAHIYLMVCLAALCGPLTILASAPISAEIIAGTWDCVTMIALENGKHSGTVRFNPGNIMYTYRADDSWQMETNLTKTHDKARINGSFKLHGSELILTKEDGSVYGDFHIELKDDGKTLIMQNEGEIISASRIPPTVKNPVN
jgi:hypothetical protein